MNDRDEVFSGSNTAPSSQSADTCCPCNNMMFPRWTRRGPLRNSVGWKVSGVLMMMALLAVALFVGWGDDRLDRETTRPRSDGLLQSHRRDQVIPIIPVPAPTVIYPPSSFSYPTPAPQPAPFTERPTTSQPTTAPSGSPTSQPSSSLAPTVSSQPTYSMAPSNEPTVSMAPSVSMQPSGKPSASASPTSAPSVSSRPSVSTSPTVSGSPSRQPTIAPTSAPSVSSRPSVSSSPSRQQTIAPTGAPVDATLVPTPTMSVSPTLLGASPTPSVAITSAPVEPTSIPTVLPTVRPTLFPTRRSSSTPSTSRSVEPTPTPTALPTARPTLSPTRRPSSTPSAFRSVEPTPTPTALPTARPTVKPTLSPTRRPTREPTGSPTFLPSPRPTLRPSISHIPSQLPTTFTKTPTSVPTVQPSSRPTGAPSPSPSAPPTLRPSARPSPASSPSPSNAPSDYPTKEPSGQPTESPSEEPSVKPSLHPSEHPTDSPTRQPSQEPSDFPTTSPSASPTVSPSLQPSANPSLQPSPEPSVVPTISMVPTISLVPSVAPTPVYEYEKVVLSSVGTRMSVRVDQQRRLQTNRGDQCREAWRGYISERIQAEVSQVIPQYETLDVIVYNATQTSLPELAVIVLEFDVRIEIRSPLTQHNVRRYIEGPFDSAEEQEALVAFLRSTDCPEFSSVSAVEVSLPRESDAGSSNGNDLNAGLIAGIAVALMAISMLIGLFVFSRVRNKRRLAAELSEEEDGPLAQAHSDRNEYLSEIGVNTVMNVSSLGDPIPMGMIHAITDASTLGPKSIDYDFQAAYEGATSEVSSQGGNTSVSHVSLPPLLGVDDDTLGAQYVSEEQIEVLAPPGVLGLILETNADGVPTINNIKPTSVLADQVRIGDRLLSVDDRDVTVLLASAVSRLIASKKDEPVRKLVFARAAKAT